MRGRGRCGLQGRVQRVGAFQPVRRVRGADRLPQGRGLLGGLRRHVPRHGLHRRLRRLRRRPLWSLGSLPPPSPPRAPSPWGGRGSGGRGRGGRGVLFVNNNNDNAMYGWVGCMTAAERAQGLPRDVLRQRDARRVRRVLRGGRRPPRGQFGQGLHGRVRRQGQGGRVRRVRAGHHRARVQQRQGLRGPVLRRAPPH
jgi:hypothetical protein